jgi:2-polyprenyl-3-methyl-5-hydroxy-6-metoxy-1,4-benzoquinol methylase
MKTLEEYWQNLYAGRVGQSYADQTLQTAEIISWHRNFIRTDLAQLSNSHTKVLDIGCGSGELTQNFLAFSNDVTGVDYIQSFVDEAAEKHAKVKFRQGDINDLAAFDRDFDIITCFGVIQNLSNLNLAITNIVQRMAGNHSRVFLTTVNCNSILNHSTRLEALASNNKNKNFRLKTYQKREFEDAADKNGCFVSRYEYLYLVPHKLRVIQKVAKFLLPNMFSHHVLIELRRKP